MKRKLLKLLVWTVTIIVAVFVILLGFLYWSAPLPKELPEPTD